MRRPRSRGFSHHASFFVYCSNYTEFGDKAKSYLSKFLPAYACVLGVELHRRGERLRTATRWAGTRGYRAVAAESVGGRSPTSKGKGGEWVLVRRDIQSRGHLARCGKGQRSMQLTAITARGFAASVIRFIHGEVLWGAVYLEASIGISHPRSQARLTEIAGIIKAVGRPFVVSGDFNGEASELQACGFLAGLHASILLPACDFTCALGEGRTLSYVVGSTVLLPTLQCWIDLSSPWRPHVGLHIAFDFEATAGASRILALPRAPPACSGPTRYSWGEFREVVEDSALARKRRDTAVFRSTPLEPRRRPRVTSARLAWPLTSSRPT